MLLRNRLNEALRKISIFRKIEFLHKRRNSYWLLSDIKKINGEWYEVVVCEDAPYVKINKDVGTRLVWIKKKNIPKDIYKEFKVTIEKWLSMGYYLQ